MNDFVKQLQGIWEGMDNNRRVMLIGGVALFLVAFFILVHIMGQPQYELLMGNLTQSDEDGIIAKLIEMKVPYKKQGDSLYTPKPEEVRAHLVESGLQMGGVAGWTIFDKTTLGATDFQNNVAYQRALQDEVRRTVRQMQGIEDAQVILTMPNDDAVFADEKVDPTASIMLKLTAPNAISQEKVVAIANFVAGTVKGMKMENVTIVDNFMNDLTAAFRNKGWVVNGHPLGDRLSARLAYEQDMEKSIESMLNKVLGPNRAVVRVNADLNLDYQEIKSETYGDQGVPRSEQEKAETYQGTGSPPGGVPGTDSNLTDYRNGTSSSANKYEKTDRTVNYEINKTEEYRVKAPGEVQRLTVSLFVDGKMTAGERKQMRDSVATAAGIDETRGDQITIANLQFNHEDPFKDAPKEGSLSWDQMIRAGALVVGLIIMLAFIFGLIRTVKKPEEAAMVANNAIEGSKIDAVIGDSQPGLTPSPTEVAVTRELSPEEQQRMERQNSLEKFAKEHPEEMAALLKAWMAED
ncbi:MAG TPA: flagellar basal-body MS-ring/collar protein FliF [Bacillota bacterium]|nr:flagellar basal-body MS-ring/collar protein FliF [Bacillota bacterium]